MAKRGKPSDGSFDFEGPADTTTASGNGHGGDGAVPLHEAAQSRYLNYALVGHHLARAAGRARRVEARAAPHPVHDVAAGTDRRRETPEVREGRRRRDGQLSPARRRRDLRDARADGAVLLAAISARRRIRQLRIARRRLRGGDAIHRVPPHAHQRRAAHRDRTEHRARTGRITTARRPSRSCCRRVCPISSSTARLASPSGWRPTSRLTTSARCARRSSSCSTTTSSATPSFAGTSRGPTFRPVVRFSTRRTRSRRSTRPAAAASAFAAPGTSARRRDRPRRFTSTAFPTRSTSRSSSSRSAKSSSSASCRSCST